jgi:hypothetical protein
MVEITIMVGSKFVSGGGCFDLDGVMLMVIVMVMGVS